MKTATTNENCDNDSNNHLNCITPGSTAVTTIAIIVYICRNQNNDEDDDVDDDHGVDDDDGDDGDDGDDDCNVFLGKTNKV